MRICGFSIPGVGRTACAALLVLGASAIPADPAAASEENGPPEYTISVVEGETTQPETDPVAMTDGKVSPHAEAILSIIHNGVVVARDKDSGGYPYISQVPQVNDVVTLESPHGRVVGSVVYDGLPSLDPTVCAGSTNFSGQRSANEEVEGSAYTVVPHPSSIRVHLNGVAQVTTLSGSSFGGNFLAPLALGETVEAHEHLKTPLAGGATFTYESENVRPVGACPVPPAPPPPPPPPALQGSIFKLLRITIHKLLKLGWLDQVTINQPGTVTQDLYGVGGAVPAYASAHGGKHRHKPPALLLAHGSATAKAAGTVTVQLRVTAKGRRALSRRHRVRAELVTTLTAGTGAKLNLPKRTVTLNR